MGRAQRATREEWMARVAQLQESGLSLTAFAAQIGVQSKTLSWWRKKVVSGARAAKPTVVSSRQGAGASAPLNFIELTAAIEGGPVEVVLSSGVAVRVRAGFDVATLTRVLDVLESRRR